MLKLSYLNCETDYHSGDYWGAPWHVTPCSLVQLDRHFGRKYCLHFQGKRTVSQAELCIRTGQVRSKYVKSDLFLENLLVILRM
jgi:hypothetical protein